MVDSEDEGSADQVRALGVEVLVTSTVMGSLDDRMTLARTVLNFAGQCRKA